MTAFGSVVIGKRCTLLSSGVLGAGEIPLDRIERFLVRKRR